MKNLKLPQVSSKSPAMSIHTIWWCATNLGIDRVTIIWIPNIRWNLKFYNLIDKILYIDSAVTNLSRKETLIVHKL